MHRKIIAVLLALCFSVLLLPNVHGAASSSADVFTGEIREKMLGRQEEIPFSFNVSKQELNEAYNDDLDAYLNEFFNTITAGVFRHDGTLKGGDYLKKHTGSYKFSTEMTTSSAMTYWKVDAVMQVSYYTNAAQEAELDQKTDSVLKELALDGLSDYEKIRRVYDYICSHVTYDNVNLKNESYTLKYSAYAALINGTAVCQGYANLFYLFMQRLGIDCRIITGLGKGEGHAWNIVKLGDLYYLLDVTWDAGCKTYRWFMKGSEDFSLHSADVEFLTDPFLTQYPIAKGSYQEAHVHIPAVLESVPPTCTETGLTEGTYCSVCGAVLKEQTEIPSSGHTPEPVPAIPSTCTEAGKTAGEICAVCGVVLTQQTEIPPSGHTPETLEAIPPTCTEAGKTAGEVCAVCGAVMTAQKSVEPLGHDLTKEEIIKEPTADEAGILRRSCTRCDYFEDFELEPIGEEPLQYTPGDVNNDGKVTASDARLALRAAVKLEKIDPASAAFLACDVNHDGVITSADARLILRAAVGLGVLK